MRALAALACFLFALTASGKDKSEPKKEPEKSELKAQAHLTDLRAEADALQLTHDLKLTVPQLKQIHAIAKKTMGKFRDKEPSRSTKEYVDKLTELRDTLSDAKDADAIDDLLDELSDLSEADPPTLNHRFDLTAEARKEATLLLKAIGPRQLAHYYSLVKEDLIDPRETLIEALTSVRTLKGDEWRKRREEIAEDVAGAAAGIDAELEAKLNDRVLALLVKTHDMSDKDFKTKSDELEKEARALFGDLTAIDILRHEAEYALAKLLANPKLLDAMNRRLKKEFF